MEIDPPNSGHRFRLRADINSDGDEKELEILPDLHEFIVYDGGEIMSVISHHLGESEQWFQEHGNLSQQQVNIIGAAIERYNL